MDEVKKALDELRSVYEGEFKALRERAESEAKKHGEATAETKAALDAIGEKLTKAEEDAVSAKARLDAIDARVQNIGNGGGATESDEVKAFRGWLADGDVAEEFKSSIREASDADGGIFVPTELDAELLKAMIEMSPVRSIVRVASTGTQSRKFRKRTGTAGAAVWTGETETRAATGGPTYAFDEVPTHELYAEHSISRWEIADSPKDMEAELMLEWADQFALAEGTAVISGSGHKQPEGILTNSDVADVDFDLSNYAAATDDTFLGDAVIGLKYELKEQYLSASTLRYLFTRATLKELRLAKDANGRYLWQPAMGGSLADSIPATIDGTPYVLVPDMGDLSTAGQTPVAVGDFKRGYVLLDRRGTQAQRDPFTQASSGLVKLSAFRRLGGQVLVPEAIKRLTNVA